MDEDIFRKLEERLGPLHARQRFGIETDHEAQIFEGLLFFHIGNWYPVHSVIRNALKLTGLYWRARRNTERILVKRNDVMFKELPPLFDGFTILHLSDMHVDMNEGAMRRLIELNQLVYQNQFNGFDMPMAYGEVFVPFVADGLLFRFGRYITLPDIEAQLAPNDYLYTRSITYSVDNYSTTVVNGSLKINRNWLLQVGIGGGTETLP